MRTPLPIRNLELATGSTLELQKRLVQLGEAAQVAQQRLTQLDELKACLAERSAHAAHHLSALVTASRQAVAQPIDVRRATLMTLLKQAEGLATGLARQAYHAPGWAPNKVPLTSAAGASTAKSAAAEPSLQQLIARHDHLVTALQQQAQAPPPALPSVDDFLRRAAEDVLAAPSGRPATDTGTCLTKQTAAPQLPAPASPATTEAGSAPQLQAPSPQQKQGPGPGDGHLDQVSDTIHQPLQRDQTLVSAIPTIVPAAASSPHPPLADFFEPARLDDAAQWIREVLHLPDSRLGAAHTQPPLLPTPLEGAWGGDLLVSPGALHGSAAAQEAVVTAAAREARLRAHYRATLQSLRDRYATQRAAMVDAHREELERQKEAQQAEVAALQAELQRSSEAMATAEARLAVLDSKAGATATLQAHVLQLQEQLNESRDATAALLAEVQGLRGQLQASGRQSRRSPRAAYPEWLKPRSRSRSRASRSPQPHAGDDQPSRQPPRESPGSPAQPPSPSSRPAWVGPMQRSPGRDTKPAVTDAATSPVRAVTSPTHSPGLVRRPKSASPPRAASPLAPSPNVLAARAAVASAAAAAAAAAQGAPSPSRMVRAQLRDLIPASHRLGRDPTSVAREPPQPSYEATMPRVNFPQHTSTRQLATPDSRVSGLVQALLSYHEQAPSAGPRSGTRVGPPQAAPPSMVHPASGPACVRCGQVVLPGGTRLGQQHECRFHPALLKDPGPLRYTPEWFACKAARHTADQPGCYVRVQHFTHTIVPPKRAAAAERKPTPPNRQQRGAAGGAAKLAALGRPRSLSPQTRAVASLPRGSPTAADAPAPRKHVPLPLKR